MAPPPTAYVGGGSNGVTSSAEKKVRMLYAYQKNGDGEISAGEGHEATLLEPDGNVFLVLHHTLVHNVQSLTSLTDGSGWIKIRTASGTGLVPASYTEPMSPTSPTPGPMTLARLPSNYSASNVSLASSITASINPATASTSSLTGPKKQGPAVAPRRGAKRVKYVEAMYAYEARSASEISISAGDKVVLVQADQGDGWCEVERGGRTGIVPASYVRDA